MERLPGYDAWKTRAPEDYGPDVEDAIDAAMGDWIDVRRHGRLGEAARVREAGYVWIDDDWRPVQPGHVVFVDGIDGLIAVADPDELEGWSDE